MTIVIPTRDRSSLLCRRALPSALAQEGVSVEILVVDDGSRDDTARAIAQQRDPRVRLIRQAAPAGASAARNAGLAQARGAWLAFLDDDDLWAPWKLADQLERASAAQADFAYAAAAVLDASGRLVEVTLPPDPEGLAARLLSRNVIPGGCSNVIARADLVRRLGGFDARLSILADWDLWIRLARSGQAAATREASVAYVWHSASMVVGTHARAAREFDYLTAKHADAFEAHGVAPDRLRFGRWLAGTELRAGRRGAAAAMYLRGALEHRSPRNLSYALACVLGERALRLDRTLVWLARGRLPRRPSWLDGCFREVPAAPGPRS